MVITGMKEQVSLGSWTEDKISHLLRESSEISDPGRRIAFLSFQFLKTRYRESTLIGDRNTPEVFVINLDGVDCFTFIEYIEAMRRSGCFRDFRKNLRKVRYRSGKIAFQHRNHFFMDWKLFNSDYIVDVTKDVSGGKSKDVIKRLNLKHDGTCFLPGVASRLQKVAYIQSMDVDDRVMEKLKTGDYMGIYSEVDGLDVSHVGIVVRDPLSTNLRHASSVEKHRKVIDEDLKNYILHKTGIIVLRPVQEQSL